MWHLPSLPYIYSSVFICLRHSYLQGKNLCKSIFSSSVFSPNVPHLRSRNHSLKHCTNSIFFAAIYRPRKSTRQVTYPAQAIAIPFQSGCRNICLPCVGKFTVLEKGNLIESIQKGKRLKMQFHRIT